MTKAGGSNAINTERRGFVSEDELSRLRDLTPFVCQKDGRADGGWC